MSRASENQKFHYNPRNVPKPPEELQRIIFPFIERWNISLNDLDASDTSKTACDSLDFMEICRTVLLQYVTQLINIGRNHILFDHEFFKIEFFLTTRNLWVLSAAQVWIQYLSHWSMYCQKPQVKSLTCTLMLMATKIPAWIFFVLTFSNQW